MQDVPCYGTMMWSPFSTAMFCSRCLPLVTVFVVEVTNLAAAQNPDLFGIGEFAKTAATAQRFQYRRRRDQCE